MSTPHIALAPMMKVTDRHFRYFLRLVSPTVVLYTEMVTAATLCHAQQPARWLDFDGKEHPVVLQLGGSSPQQLAQAVVLANPWGFDEINLNIGCPSDRVQSGRFGACLMREPALVAECVAAMQAVAECPITVKTRIGVDHDDDYAFLKTFVSTVAETGCDTFIIHARKAWLKGLSPKQNRQIPELNYPRVWQLKQDFSTLKIIANGGIDSVENVEQQLQHCDGVMIGRQLENNPMWLALLESKLGIGGMQACRMAVFEAYWAYAKSQPEVSWSILLRPLYGLAWGLPGAKQWRRLLAEGCQDYAKLVAALRA